MQLLSTLTPTGALAGTGITKALRGREKKVTYGLVALYPEQREGHEERAQ